MDEQQLQKLIDAIGKGKVSRDDRERLKLVQEEIRKLKQKQPLTTQENKLLEKQLEIAKNRN